MVSINKVHKIVKALSNTDSIGNVKRETIDLFIDLSVNELYEDVFYDINKLINRQNRGLLNTELENTTEKVRERILHYLEDQTLEKENNTFNIPNELRYVDTLIYEEEIIELCKNYKDFILNKKNASLDFPIALKHSNSLNIFPEEIEKIQITYLRNPIPAKWTYRVFNNTELFDPSLPDFRNIDIHDSQEDELIISVLNKIGINLKEKDLQNITQRIEQKEFQQERDN